jgi:phenylpyruvate tautomerase PptA (4-oxalocrotonate tautomerase family)
MPFLKIQTNRRLSEEAAQSLASKGSAMVVKLLGKPEAYVMVSVETNTAMRFAGATEPLAYIELKSIGLPESITTPASKALCDLVAAETGVRPEHIYIEFANAAPGMWGWNGDTF